MKKNEYFRPSVIDFAYEIMALHEENQELRRQVEHYKELEEIHLDSLRSSDEHQKEFLGIILGAALDPNSALNKGQAALIEKQYGETE